jgi:hypothetical protein
MKQQTADTVANVTVGLAVAGVAYFILKTPPLRRLAMGLAITAVTGTLPAWLSREVQHAWARSGDGAWPSSRPVSRQSVRDIPPERQLTDGSV